MIGYFISTLGVAGIALVIGAIVTEKMGAKVKTVWRRYDSVPPQELENIFRIMPPVYISAIYQLVDDLKKEALDGAQTAIGNPGISAGCVGGTEHLERLREQINIWRASKKQPQSEPAGD